MANRLERDSDSGWSSIFHEPAVKFDKLEGGSAFKKLSSHVSRKGIIMAASKSFIKSLELEARSLSPDSFPINTTEFLLEFHASSLLRVIITFSIGKFDFSKVRHPKSRVTINFTSRARTLMHNGERCWARRETASGLVALNRIAPAYKQLDR